MISTNHQILHSLRMFTVSTPGFNSSIETLCKLMNCLHCVRIIVLQLTVLVYWRVKFLSIIPVFVLHVRLRVDWVCLLYGHITVCIWCYLLSVSVCLFLHIVCFFTALWRINVFISFSLWLIRDKLVMWAFFYTAWPYSIFRLLKEKILSSLLYCLL